MSLPRDLDEIPSSELIAELSRRERLVMQNRCTYCSRLRTEPVCRFPARHGGPTAKNETPEDAAPVTRRAPISLSEDEYAYLYETVQNHDAEVNTALADANRNARIHALVRAAQAIVYAHGLPPAQRNPKAETSG